MCVSLFLISAVGIIFYSSIVVKDTDQSELRLRMELKWNTSGVRCVNARLTTEYIHIYEVCFTSVSYLLEIVVILIYMLDICCQTLNVYFSMSHTDRKCLINFEFNLYNWMNTRTKSPPKLLSFDRIKRLICLRVFWIKRSLQVQIFIDIGANTAVEKRKR